MPYSEEIEARLNKVISGWKHTDARKMFGGVCHLINGNMFCGVYKDFLILRLGEKKAEEVLRQPHAKPFDITGKPMKGWVMIDQKGFRTDERLKEWLNKAKEYVKTLPPK